MLKVIKLGEEKHHVWQDGMYVGNRPADINDLFFDTHPNTERSLDAADKIAKALTEAGLPAYAEEYDIKHIDYPDVLKELEQFYKPKE